MDDIEFESTFEQVYDFASELKYNIREVPYFAGKEDVKYYLNEAFKICDEWIDDNRERFEKIYYDEMRAMDSEFERSRL